MHSSHPTNKFFDKHNYMANFVAIDSIQLSLYMANKMVIMYESEERTFY